VVPGRFLLFRAPRDDLTKGALWADSDARGARNFSTAFFADLFDVLGVAQVPCTHTCIPRSCSDICLYKIQ
jgi:hypothetical protein